MKDCSKRILDLQVLKLIDSVYKSDFESIDRIFNNGFRNIFNYSEPYEGKTALITSVLTGNHVMTEYLIKLGSDLNVVDLKKRTALMFACQLGDFKTTEILCLNKANLNLIDSDLKSALIHCFISDSPDHLKCIEILLKYGADCNLKISGKTPFLMACERSKFIENLCISIVLSGKADLSVFDENNGNFALHYSSLNGSVNLSFLLLKHGSSPDCENFSKQTPSHFAAQYKHIDLIKILWSFGANLDAIDHTSDKAINYVFKNFDFSKKNEYFKVAKILCNRGASQFDKNYQSSLLPKAIKFNKLRIKIFIMTKKVLKKYSSFYSSENVDQELSDEYFRYWMLRIHDIFTLVSKLIEEIYERLLGKTKFIDKKKYIDFLTNIIPKIPHIILDKLFDLLSSNDILEKERLFDIRTLRALSAPKFHLHKGLRLKPIRNSNKKLKTDINKNSTKIFIPKQNIDPKGEHFQTLLSECIDPLRSFDYTEEQRWSNDAKWYLNPKEKTKIEFNNLVNCGDINKIKKILSKKTTEEVENLMNLQDKFYKTPLMIAVSNQNEKMIDFLLEFKIDINLTDNFKWTALHHAVYSGNLRIIKKLVDKKARILIKNIGGRTALDLAIILNQTSIENYFKKIFKS